MPFVAGNDVDGYCSSCERDTEHIVLEAHRGVVHRVRCKTCKSDHPYQKPHTAPKPKKAAKKPRAPRKSTKKPAVPKRAPWEVLIDGRDLSGARPYGIKERFESDELISHPKFGIGVITAVLEDGKIEVEFQESPRKLIHAREA